MNNVFSSMIRFFKVTAITSVLGLCALQGVRADTPPPNGSGGGPCPFPPSSAIIYQDNFETDYLGGTVYYNLTGIWVFPDGTQLLPDGTVVLPD